MTTLQSIRDFICLNQKELIQYEYIVSEEHKKLRVYLETSSNIDKDKLEELIQNLIDIAYGNLLNILRNNVPKINDMIKSVTSGSLPRITIKTLERDVVLDFFRSHALATLNPSSIEENTGFSTIMNSSNVMSYINNDIKQDFLEGKYTNPRLKTEFIEKLKNKEISWEECWHPIDGIGEKFYYNSTLIIPMAIRLSDNDSENFIKKFSKNIEYKNGLRTVWGFLCFDSEETNLFLDYEEELKDIGYIVADVLSLYLMFFYNHISGSETFLKAINHLKEE